MTEHINKGKEGEKIALNYLKKQDYVILNCNWRFQHLEIDIIAQKGQLLVIVEVKTRNSADFGEPETFVDKKKQKNLIKAAHEYIIQHNWPFEVRFDIISVIGNQNTEQIHHIEDAFSTSH